MQNLRRIVACLVLVGVVGTMLRAETRHIHLIKVFDNENADYVIREGCRSVGFGIDREVQMLASSLGILNVIEYNVSGPNFNLAHLDQVIDYDMAYQERDIVIFVYVGHGFRDPLGESAYPNFYFNSYDQSVNFLDIQERIQDKNPSLLLNIVVACNVTVTDLSVPPPFESINIAPEVVQLPGVQRFGAAYEGLFAEEQGMTKVVNLFSADKEFYTFISNDGGIFFNEILYTLQEALSGRLASGWSEICATIADRTVQRSTVKGLEQQPLCEYALRLSPLTVRPEAGRGWLAPSPCAQAARRMRDDQKDELRTLRRSHREAMRNFRDSDAGRAQRRLLAQTQRVEYETRKLRHEKEYQRQLLPCQ